MNTHFLNNDQQPTTFLLVDDDDFTRARLGMRFENMSFFDTKKVEILTASNGKEGVECLKAHKKDICAIILDINMPVMDGLEMLRRLAKDAVTDQIPVFILTDEKEADTIHAAYDLGAIDVISKQTKQNIEQEEAYWKLVYSRIKSVLEVYAARNNFEQSVRDQTKQLSIQNEQLEKAFKQLEFMYSGVIEALATATEFRSGESGEHVRRIHDITKLLLSETPLGDGYDEATITQIAKASVLHDVGKISIPDRILNFPGRLNAEDFKEMKQHTVYGEKLLTQIPQLKNLPFYDFAKIIARHHHERWDGNGYPDRLVGDEIPLYAQVVSIADVYDALVSTRVYKPPFPHGDAIGMIKQGKCGIFNPALLESFIEISPKIEELYRQNQGMVAANG